MAQYLGSVQGQRGEASRLGSKSSGLRVKANGWHSGVTVQASYNEESSRDEFLIWATGGSNGHCFDMYLGKITTTTKGELQFTPADRH